MKIVVFGLSISSSWGNGHATLWRGLIGALHRKGCAVTFFERDVPYYADTRDIGDIGGGKLVIYSNWDEVRPIAQRDIRDADAVITTSFCPDALAARALAEEGPGLNVFYDLDTPVTLASIEAGRDVFYIGDDGLRSFDLVLSFTGGGTETRLKRELGARCVVPLYGHVDPKCHRRVEARDCFASDLSYLGTYSSDRQTTLEELLLKPAMASGGQRFVMGGAQYPADFPWLPNLFFVRHLPPAEHSAFYSSSRLTLNVTRSAMAETGWCPSGRLFEASACRTVVVSDAWPGIEEFYAPGEEIIVAKSSGDVSDALALSDFELRRMGEAALERTLSQHTSDHRADELLGALSSVGRSVHTMSAELR
jgi:spore maturation protein CgeB